MPQPIELTLKKTSEFRAWYGSLGSVDQTKVDARLDNMQLGIFKNSRALSGDLFESKWKSGMRLYYSRRRIAGVDVIALWGGFKGTQRKDIAKARRIKKRYEDAYKNEEG